MPPGCHLLTPFLQIEFLEKQGRKQKKPNDVVFHSAFGLEISSQKNPTTFSQGIEDTILFSTWQYMKYYV